MSVTPISKPETKAAMQPQTGTQYVFFFGAGKAEGNGKMKDELGGKGAGLAEMTNAALPVPPGFTIQTAACREYMKTSKVSDALERQMTEALARLEDEYRAAGPASAGLFDQLQKSLTHEPDRPSPADTAHEFGMTESAVRQASYRLRQRYRQVLREEIAHTVMLPGDIDDELRHLVAVLRA